MRKRVLIIGSLCALCSSIQSNANSNLKTICTFEKESALQVQGTQEVKNLVGADNGIIAILITRKNKKVQKKLQTIEKKRVSALTTNKICITSVIRDIYQLYPVGFTGRCCGRKTNIQDYIQCHSIYCGIFFQRINIEFNDYSTWSLFF